MERGTSMPLMHHAASYGTGNERFLGVFVREGVKKRQKNGVLVNLVSATIHRSRNPLAKLEI
jgi:hypothetical protein